MIDLAPVADIAVPRGPLPAHADNPPPAPAGQEAGLGNFAVLALGFDTLEWLWLHHAGHRRARFTWAAEGSPHAAWLVP